jgi:aryl-alcohol dehydrogenase-like predicted oxidoreductase
VTSAAVEVDTLVAGAAPVPRIVLGTASLGTVLPDALVSAGSRERAFRHLDAILEAGCPTLDLAASYMIGGTERLVGAWIASRRNRERLTLITKGGHPLPVLQPHRITPRAITDDLHASLRRLRVERVDLYLLHRDDETGAPLDPLLETLAEHQRAGKIGAWGVSNWTHERIAAIDALARTAGVPGAAASSPHFSLLEWRAPPFRGCVSLAGEANREARAFYARTRIPVLAWSPLGHGFFARRGGGTYATEANAARRRRAETLAEQHGATAAQIALAYLFHQPFPVFAVVSAGSGEHMKSNLAATSIRLGDDEVRWLASGDEVSRDSPAADPAPGSRAT